MRYQKDMSLDSDGTAANEEAPTLCRLYETQTVEISTGAVKRPSSLDAIEYYERVEQRNRNLQSLPDFRVTRIPGTLHVSSAPEYGLPFLHERGNTLLQIGAARTTGECLQFLLHLHT